ncbi:MAG TPA: LapA family protein [Candidatus Dormibacteraeota bacterium]|nr:LapA family protein [Candidatus Dormibacteraeota bacterium]
MTILALLILALLVMVVLVNLLTGTQAPSVSLVFWSKTNVPLGYVIALSALTGAVMTWLAAIPKHVQRFWTIRRLEGTVAEKERAYATLAKEAADLRAAAAPPASGALAPKEEAPAVRGEYQQPPG